LGQGLGTDYSCELVRRATRLSDLMAAAAAATLSSRSPLLEEGQAGMVDRGSSHQRTRRYPRLRGGEGEEILMVVGGACVAFIIVIFAWINFMYAVVPPNHVGISFNSWTKQVDYSQLYTPGRVFSGPFYTYITFPLNIQNLQMRVMSRTSEGYPLDLKVEFQYQLMPDKILELYKHYTIKYEPVFQRNVRTALMKSVSDYDASDLFQKRSSMLEDMQYRVDKVLRKSYATCWGIQFDDVNQPAIFEKTLLTTQLQIWFAQTKLAEQKVSAITSNTSVLKAEFDKNISVVNSTATAKCKYIISAADAESNNYQNEANANATLITDKANAAASIIKRQATADAELSYQEAVAAGAGHVLREQAQSTVRTKQLQGLRLKYWKEVVGLSQEGLVKFQRLLGSYKHLEDVKFLFGFSNTYATAEASNVYRGGAPGAANLVEMAAIGGAAAATGAAKAAEHPDLVEALDVPVFAEKDVPDLQAMPEL